MVKPTKNILFVSHSYRFFVKDNIERVSNDFNNVTVLYRYNPISEISNIFPINYLKPFRKSSIIDLLKKPSNVNVLDTPTFYLPTDSGYKNLGEKHFKAAEKKIDQHGIKFDLIHSQFVWSSGYVGAKLKEKYGVPLVVSARGYDIYNLPFRDEVWRDKIEYVLNTADFILPVSNSNLECIKKLNVQTPAKVIPNGFNSNLFYPRDLIKCRKVLGLPTNKKIILTVGNLVEVKGQQYLIDAMRAVVDCRKDVLCVIVGSGKLENKLKKHIKKTGLEKYVILAGGKSHNEIPNWINSCDVFILPSLNEGNPNVMFECLGCGKPFIGTKVGGIPDIIVSDDYGYVVEPKNSDGLAENILVALDKDWDYFEIEEYSKQFNWDNLAKVIPNIYSKLLE